MSPIGTSSKFAVTLNDQQDYFGQTVNVASRVQGLAASRSIVVTE
jgi:class 3 adenylate cyclase